MKLLELKHAMSEIKIHWISFREDYTLQKTNSEYGNIVIEVIQTKVQEKKLKNE